jgi:hypothetical protein
MPAGPWTSIVRAYKETIELESTGVIEYARLTDLRYRVASKGEILWLRARTSLR